MEKRVKQLVAIGCSVFLLVDCVLSFAFLSVVNRIAPYHGESQAVEFFQSASIFVLGFIIFTTVLMVLLHYLSQAIWQLGLIQVFSSVVAALIWTNEKANTESKTVTPKAPTYKCETCTAETSQPLTELHHAYAPEFKHSCAKCVTRLTANGQWLVVEGTL